MPKVTVLMPVFNGEAYLKESIQSILDQTFNDYEFLIIDDGSTDKSSSIIDSFSDPRIRFERYNNHRGTVHVLNSGIRLSRGEYIARMDCDDISLPHRLANQVRFMDTHPDTGVSGCAMRLIKKGRLKNIRYQPESDQELKIALLFKTCFFHPTVIMRRSLAARFLYPENLIYTQDYNFWTRLARETCFANLRETLVYFREHPGQVSSKRAATQKTNARSIRASYFQALFEETTAEDLEIHHHIAENSCGIDLEKAKEWLEHLIELNARSQIFQSGIFLKAISRKWWDCCKKNTHYGKDTLNMYRSSYLHKHHQPGIFKYLKFYGRCLWKKNNRQRN